MEDGALIELAIQYDVDQIFLVRPDGNYFIEQVSSGYRDRWVKAGYRSGEGCLELVNDNKKNQTNPPVTTCDHGEALKAALINRVLLQVGPQVENDTQRLCPADHVAAYDLYRKGEPSIPLRLVTLDEVRQHL